MTYFVAEQFVSINGEGRRAGQLAFFVRFRGCNLHCTYCDTRWANTDDCPAEERSAEEILADIRKSAVKNVTLTGGEPLLRAGIRELLTEFSIQADLSVEIETNGSVDLKQFMDIPNRPSFTMDYKLPSSGMEGKMCLTNLALLDKRDTLKFVCGSWADLERARDIMTAFHLIGRVPIYLSPVFGSIDPSEMVEFMKAFHLNDVNLQLQLHKFIWNPEERGV